MIYILYIYYIYTYIPIYSFYLDYHALTLAGRKGITDEEVTNPRAAHDLTALFGLRSRDRPTL